MILMESFIRGRAAASSRLAAVPGSTLSRAAPRGRSSLHGWHSASWPWLPPSGASSGRQSGPPDTVGRPAGTLLLLLLAALASAAGSLGCGPTHSSRPRVPVLAGGIQVNEPDHDAWVASVQAAGLNAVQVTVYARQQAWDSAEMVLPSKAPAVEAEIRTAHRAGLDVVLVLRTALDHGLSDNRHLWHGMIWPRRDRVDAWFERYGEFALWGARLAARENVEMLAVASELNSLTSTVRVDELPDLYSYFLDRRRTALVRRRLVDCAATVPRGALQPDLAFRDGTRYPDLAALLHAEEEANRAWARRVVGGEPAAGQPPENPDLEVLNRRRQQYEDRWRSLIRRVRDVYPGPLTYAANFDQVEEVGFWDALDAIGVNAYYRLGLLGLEGPVLEEEMVASWRRIANELGALASRIGGDTPLPVVITELGWTAKAGATVRPYSYHRVEVLETSGRRPDGGIPLSCVHWATQPEAPTERIRALRALLDVVRRDNFPALRGFMLWKLTTLPSHRQVEPFAIVLPGPRTTLPPLPGRLDGEMGRDRADALLLGVAAELAEVLREGASRTRR